MTDDHAYRGDDVHSVEESMKDANGGWQPIETAPKDETRVLIFTPIEGISTASFAYGDQWDDGINIPPLPTPTHWQPLPAAPTEGE
jgi:hypothetical protein